MEIDKVCRLCADASEKPFHSVFSKNENGQQLIQLIKQCLPILIYRTDPLSKEICQKCYVKLNEYSSFQKNTIKIQDDNKLKLFNRLHESPVKLYVDTLEDAFHPEHIQITNCRSLRPFRSCASQIQVETQTSSTNTGFEQITIPKGLSLKNLTILTPSKINEKSDTNVFVSKINEDGVVLKKRKLNGPRAGPRCKTRPHLKPYNLTFQPLTLLQYALKQINRNFNLFDEVCSNSLDSFATEETTETADTGSIYQDYDEYTPSPDVSTMESSEYSAADLQIDVEAEPEPEFEFHCDVDINAPAMCNYCMKKFPNLSELAGHEINHIKVDIGPRVGTKEFNMLFTKLAFYFNDYLRRQDLLPPKEVKQITKPVTRNISKSPATKTSSSKAVFKAIASKPVKTTPIKIEPQSLEFLKTPKLETKYEVISKPVTRPKEKINYQDIDQPYDDDNSLLVPNIATNNQNHEYKIENDEIFVDGILLRNMEKNERKACYKDIMVDGVKRKFCPLCRYTFKDNWSIENHYMSGICLYTCKFCGGKFKYHKELFESHLITHKGETATKVFGPRDRQFKKKVKNKRLSRSAKPAVIGHAMTSVPDQKVKPIKIKQLMQKNAIKMSEIQTTKIKLEPGLVTPAANNKASTSNSNEPYQAYFCRRCFKVFFNVNEYNTHIRVCCGGGSSTPPSNTPKTKHTPLRQRDKLSETRVSTPDSSSSSKRPIRACVRESLGLSSDNDSQGSDSLLKRSRKQITNEPDKVPENVWECGICCSSFPSKYSRNSHMRIHKGQVANTTKLTPPPKTKLSMTSKQELQQTVAANFMQQQYHHQPLHFPPKQLQQQKPQQQTIQYPNLNPAVARLVQNNPHLTIRSYSKSQQQQQQQQQQQLQLDVTPVQPPQRNQHHLNDSSPESASAAAEHSIKRNYKCADCDEKFENKSVLYYHKMNSCIVKRHYECAFCRKKFGTYDQYNTHMFYVHPE